MKRTLSILLASLSSALLFAGENSIQTQTLKTPWADEVSTQSSRPEYPRPQMVRSGWTNLNGLWSYALSEAEATVMPQAQGQILVPFCIESNLSGVGKRVGKEQALWYKTTLNAPAKAEGKKVLLHFDAVDWKAEVWLGEEYLGSHTGGYTPFSFDITSALAKSNELIVKVWDPSDDPAYNIPHGKQVNNPSGIWYTPVTGIWQTVWMETVSNSYIKDYNVLTSTSGKIDVSVDVEGEADEVRVELLCPRRGYNPEKAPWGIFRKAKASVKVGSVAELKVRRPRLWSPDKPYLYGLRIKLYKDGRMIDKVDGYTAIRSISIKADEAGVKRLALNDEILFQFGPLDQGWWPDGLYTAPTAEAMAFDIIKTKELGFNTIRKHIKVEPSRWYYDCDRLGMLVWQDMPSIGVYTNPSDWSQGEDYYGSGKDYVSTCCQKENYYKEWAEIIAHNKKFQSIVVWVPFNEGWGQFDTQKAVDFTRNLDPTRLINAASGGNWVEGAGDILDSHHYPQPKMRILDDSTVNVLGEYGGIGCPIEGHTWEIGKKWGYIQYDTPEKVTDCYVTYANDLVSLIQLDRCAAAIYTQTTDVEGEVNGFYTYDRKVLKMDAKRVRKANRAVIEAPVTNELPLVRPSAFHYKDPSAGLNHHLNLYTLKAGNITMQVTNFGARIISLFAPDRNGTLDDIVVGYGDAKRFVHNTGERFLGATVGRVANRIGGGTFSLDGKRYHLPINNNGQTLHGGLKGIDMVVWQVKERSSSSITFTYTAPDGADGFPGNLCIELTYTLTDSDALDISYKATTDAATPVNLSNHAFYNLRGSKGGPIGEHVLTIAGSGITPVDEVLIPTGEIMDVTGTPFDFRAPHAIAERVGENHPQLGFGGGYDHNWVLDAPAGDGELHKACELYEPESGRVLEVFTDQPGLQFYGGNFFDGSYAGKVPEVIIGYREALALETQKFPDAVNKPQFPNTILRPGETYTHHSVYSFSAR